MMNKRYVSGFTLIELLTVIAVIAIISTLSLGSFTAAQRKNRDNRRKSDLNLIAQTIDLYYAETRTVPKHPNNSCDPISSNSIKNSDEPWIKELGSDYLPTVRGAQLLPRDPKDPDRSYIYQCIENEPGKSFMLLTVLEGNDPESPDGIYRVTR